MPQLDYLTYTSQIFWFLITFSVLYLKITTVYLPKIAKIQKIRYKTKISDNTKITQLKKKKNKTNLEFEQILKKNFKLTQKKIINQKQVYEQNIEKTLQNIQKDQLKQSNKKYIKTIINLNLYTYLTSIAIKG